MLIACCQIEPDVAEPAGNPGRARAAIRAAVAAGAQLVVLPELVNSGYVFDSPDEVRRSAEPADGALLRGWAEEAAAGSAVVVGGFCEAGDDGRVYNSAAVVDSRGVLAVYRKLHLWDREQGLFTAGDAPAPVVDTPFGRLGVGVCYDIELPELPRGLALAGADVLVFPTNWPHLPDRPRMLSTLAAATAYVSRVFVAVCDRCGEERGVTFEGGSVVAAPDGGIRAGPPPARGPATLLADCDLREARDKAVGERNDVFADRRPRLYHPALTDGRT